MGQPGKAPNNTADFRRVESHFPKPAGPIAKYIGQLQIIRMQKWVGAASLGLPIAPPTARKVFVQGGAAEEEAASARVG